MIEAILWMKVGRDFCTSVLNGNRGMKTAGWNLAQDLP